MRLLGSLVTTLLVAVAFFTYAQQSVSIGTNTVDRDAVLFLLGDGNQGIVLPKTSDLAGMPKKAGMVVYNETDGQVYSCDGNQWLALGGGNTSVPPVLTLNGNELSIFNGVNVNLAATAPTTPGQIMMWDGTKWTVNTAGTLVSGDVLEWNGNRWQANGNYLKGINGTAPISVTTINNVAQVSVSNITNNEISNSAGIVDTKLATISTAGKVSGSAINSGTISGSTAINTTGNITTTGTLGVTGTTTLSSLSGVGNRMVIADASGVITTAPLPLNSTLTNLTSPNAAITIGNGTNAVIGLNPVTIDIPNASGSQTGLLTSTDFTTFSNKQNTISLTTTGTSGAATLVGNTLNIPNYAGTTYTNGTGLTLTGNTFSVNTSQNISNLTNLNTNGLVRTTGGTGALSIASPGTDYLVPFTAQSANTFFAAPSSSSGLPTFRAIVASDIPTLNQNTTGTAATVTTNANLTGEVTSVGNAATIANTAGNSIISAINNGGTLGTINDNRLATISTAGKVSGSAITSGTIGGSTVINTTGTATVAGLTIGSTAINWPANAGGVLTNNGTGILTWAPAAGTGDLLSTNNLSDLADAATARTNLGLGSLAQLSAVGSAEITDGTIANVDILDVDASKITGTLTIAQGGTGASTPAVALANLGAMSNALTNQNIFVGSAGNIATGVPMSGDATISNTGAVTIANGAIGGGLGGKINDNTITNDDISSSAAIAGTKINANFGLGNISTTGTLTVSGGTTLSNASLQIGTLPYTWPAAHGAAGAVLTNNGAGVLSWGSVSSWGLTGNASTVDGTNYIGTSDNIPLNFRVNNQRAGRIEAAPATANAFYGFQAGNVNTGTFNAAFGYSAMTVNTSGQGNAALGYRALANNTTGNSNTSMGFSSLVTNTTGGGNTAVGSEALRNLAVGSDNTAVGQQALRNTTGAANVALGSQAAVTLTSGNDNAAIGSGALFSTTTGSTNTAVGNASLSNNVTGSGNTALGYNAEVATGALTNATAIGANASVTTSNTIQLGDAAVTTVNVGTGTTAKLVSGQLQITGGSLIAGHVLTSDASGNATWQSATGGGWGLTGNASTNPATQFIGTSDAQDLKFKVNGQHGGEISQSGSLANTSFGFNAAPNGTGSNATTAFGTNALSGVTTGDNNVAVGTAALQGNSTGRGNTAVGSTALTTNNGDYNAALGLGALNANNAGSFNTALGTDASRNTNATGNTAVGFSSMITNTSGTNNTALGYNTNVAANNLTNATALGANASVTASNTIQLGDAAVTTVNIGTGTTAKLVAGQLQITGGTIVAGHVLTSDASGNATWQVGGSGWGLTGNAATVDGTNFIGTTDNIPLSFRVNNQLAARIDNSVNNNYFGFLAGNTGPGENNTAVGGSALSAVTSGEFNTAIGNFALQSNTNGIENMAGGYSALGANLAGSNNSALGFYALRNANANFNSALGHSAGLTVTTGTRNTLLGANADVLTNSLTKATAIGYNAKVGASNSLVLGGTGVDAVNVGIGTSTPLTDIQIGTTAHLFDFPGATGLSFNLYESAGNILHTNTNGGSLLALQDGQVGLFVNADAAANSTFGSSMVNRLILTETGVSINKDAPDPSAVLHVVSETVGGGGTPRGFMMPSLITSDRNAIPSPLEGLMIYNETDGEFNFYDGASWQAVGGGSSGWGLTGNTLAGTERLGSDNAQPLIFETNNTERLRIDATGNIGIGTLPGTNPKVSVNQNTAQGSNIGIQTIVTNGTTTNTGQFVSITGSGTSQNFGVDAFVTDGDLAMGVRGIASDGQVSNWGVSGQATGAGATNYGVYGTASGGTTNWAGYFDGSTGINGNLIVSTGNVGINTPSPTSALEVNGQVKITGGVPGIGKVLTSDASGLASWTTPSGTTLITNPGTRNLLAGDLAGAVNTGTDNVFMGWSAGNDNTTAGQNVFIGSAAGIVNITGGLSTIIGWRAGHLGTNIQGNTLIGAEAGRSSNASINTFVGEKSGQNTTTGGENVMLGSFTGATNITGSQLTMIGRSADVSASNLTNATAIGSRATVGQSNSLVLGSINGVNGATNDTRVGIGTTTPSATLDVSSGGGSVTPQARIYQTNGVDYARFRFASAGSGASNWDIGALITGTASTEQLNFWNQAGGINVMSLTGDGRVGIGTTTPATSLQVNGSLSLSTRVTSGTLTLLATDYLVINTGAAATWTWPPSPTLGRILILVNHGTGLITTSTAYRTASGTTATTITFGTSVQLVYDGTEWRKIN